MPSVTAPLVVSTLYNGLWSDSLSGHFTKLCTHTYVMNSSFQPPCWSSNSSANSSVCFYSKKQSSFISTPRKTIAMSRSLFEELIKPHSLHQALLLQEVFLWWRTLCKNFLAVYPAPKPPTSFRNWYIRLFGILLAKTETRYVCCRRTNCLYMIKCKFNI